MAGLSVAEENNVINARFRNQTVAQAVTLYFALFTAAPTDTGGGTEVSGGSYARVGKTATTAGFGAPSGGSAANIEEIDFGTATANWGTVTHFGVYDASTAGNLMGWGVLATSKVINTTDGGKFPIGALILNPD